MAQNKPKFILDFEKPLQELERQLDQLRKTSHENRVDVSKEILGIEGKIESMKRDIYSHLTAWQKVQLSRHPRRPYSMDYIAAIFEDFQELHGDRRFRDDRAMVAGTALLDGRPIAVIGQQKGRDTKENLMRNFGAPSPEGYRKAHRVMKLAEKFSLPVITFIDTAGAYPGTGSEERHVGEAIAFNIQEMSQLKTPIIAIIIGEGGSGGALGIGFADSVLIFENAYYSVISPEGCAAILWKDRANASEAAEALQITGDKLLHFKIVDEIIPEPLGGAHLDPQAAAIALKIALKKHLDRFITWTLEDLLAHRYEKFRSIGVFQEAGELVSCALDCGKSR